MTANPSFKHKVQIFEPNGSGLEKTYECLRWLLKKRWYHYRTFEIDMHSGKVGYSTFYFKNEKRALEFKLTHG